MHNKKTELDGPFAGLWIRTAKALRGGGYTTREKVSADIKSGKLRAHLSIHDYGIKTDIEVVTWLVYHGDITQQDAGHRFRQNFGKHYEKLRKTKLFQSWNERTEKK